MYQIHFQEPFYLGLGVCAHDNKAIERAVFSNVELKTILPGKSAGASTESTLETVAIAFMDRRVVYHTRDHIEAPNWSRDGKYFLFNRDGRICKLPGDRRPAGNVGHRRPIHCNNDHGISPDSTLLAISDQSQPDEESACVRLAHRRRHASPRHQDCAVLLARLVARRQNARLCRPAQWRL